MSNLLDRMALKASIKNMMSNSKFLNKEIIHFNLQITPNFDLSTRKNFIYNYFKLRLPWSGFDLVN